MRTSRYALAGLVTLATLGAAGLEPAALAAHARAGAPAALRRSLNLWATIDVCHPADQPHIVGVRGSMPGNKIAGDEIFMRFRLQYQSPAGAWVDLRSGASPGFIRVGSAKTARQDGWSFQLMPTTGNHATTLRGVVTFEWRRGTTVLASVSRATTAGHQSLAGADPPGYSAAACSIA